MRVGTLHTFRSVVTMLSFTGVVLLLYR